MLREIYQILACLSVLISITYSLHIATSSIRESPHHRVTLANLGVVGDMVVDGNRITSSNINSGSSSINSGSISSSNSGNGNIGVNGIGDIVDRINPSTGSVVSIIGRHNNINNNRPSTVQLNLLTKADIASLTDVGDSIGDGDVDIGGGSIGIVDNFHRSNNLINIAPDSRSSKSISSISGTTSSSSSSSSNSNSRMMNRMLNSELSKHHTGGYIFDDDIMNGNSHRPLQHLSSLSSSLSSPSLSSLNNENDDLIYNNNRDGSQQNYYQHHHHETPLALQELFQGAAAAVDGVSIGDNRRLHDEMVMINRSPLDIRIQQKQHKKNLRQQQQQEQQKQHQQQQQHEFQQQLHQQQQHQIQLQQQQQQQHQNKRSSAGIGGGGGGGGGGGSSGGGGGGSGVGNSPPNIPPITHSMASQLIIRSARGQRQYDVPQIECPPAMDGMERFACPTPDRQGRYRCIDDHVLCDGFIDCPEGEDEDRQACMFYKTTKAHLDVLADALLRWARGR